LVLTPQAPPGAPGARPPPRAAARENAAGRRETPAAPRRWQTPPALDDGSGTPSQARGADTVEAGCTAAAAGGRTRPLDGAGRTPSPSGSRHAVAPRPPRIIRSLRRSATGCAAESATAV